MENENKLRIERGDDLTDHKIREILFGVGLWEVDVGLNELADKINVNNLKKMTEVVKFLLSFSFKNTQASAKTWIKMGYVNSGNIFSNPVLV